MGVELKQPLVASDIEQAPEFNRDALGATRMRRPTSLLAVSAVGAMFLFGGCVSAAQGCDWPDVDPAGWSPFKGTGFAVLVPPAYELTYAEDGDREVRLWRAGERTLKSDWGDESVVTGGRRARWEGDIDWRLCEVMVGGYRAQVVTYQTQKGYFVVEAFWADLPSTDWRTGGIRPALWIVATGPDRAAQRQALAIVRTVTFAR